MSLGCRWDAVAVLGAVGYTRAAPVPRRGRIRERRRVLGTDGCALAGARACKEGAQRPQ